MIYLRRSGSALTVGNGDLSYLQQVARSALDRGETVELHIDARDWQPVASYQEADNVLHELYDELDARRDALAESGQLPLLGDAS